jgi:hypothetical protein
MTITGSKLITFSLIVYYTGVFPADFTFHLHSSARTPNVKIW